MYNTINMNTSKEYLAGLFDGEGCVWISKNIWHKSSTGKFTNPVYSLNCSINMTHKGIIENLHNSFGGCFNAHNHKNINHATLYSWIIASRKAKSFLELILPYTIVKREQIVLGLEFQTHIDNIGRTWTRTKGLTQDIL